MAPLSPIAHFDLVVSFLLFSLILMGNNPRHPTQWFLMQQKRLLYRPPGLTSYRRCCQYLPFQYATSFEQSPVCRRQTRPGQLLDCRLFLHPISVPTF